MFYPAEADACRALAKSFVRTPANEQAWENVKWIGGIVPHAGWICSGAIAGQAMAAIARSSGPVDIVVVFGAIHSPAPIDVAALDPHASWAVPGGQSELPGELERRLTESSANLFRVDERFHTREHAVEVELPLIQIAWPHATVLPVEVPVVEHAAQIGIATAKRIEQAGLSAVYLASSDLTHYGPNYRFAPQGVGLAGLEWAKANDRRLLSLVTDMAVERIVPEVSSRFNACGGGAIAAMLAACRERGATRGAVLRHANSYETLQDVAPQRPDNAVGYAAVVVG
jgi:AmmeMemoRadiSam system protein B